jgi:hypothetical protein
MTLWIFPNLEARIIRTITVKLTSFLLWSSNSVKRKFSEYLKYRIFNKTIIELIYLVRCPARTRAGDLSLFPIELEL